MLALTARTRDWLFTLTISLHACRRRTLSVCRAAAGALLLLVMNFIGLGLEPSEPFLFQIRRVETRADFFRVCEDFLNHDRSLPLEPISAGTKEADLASCAG